MFRIRRRHHWSKASFTVKVIYIKPITVTTGTFHCISSVNWHVLYNSRKMCDQSQPHKLKTSINFYKHLCEKEEKELYTCFMTSSTNLSKHLQAAVLQYKQPVFVTSNQNLHCSITPNVYQKYLIKLITSSVLLRHWLGVRREYD